MATETMRAMDDIKMTESKEHDDLYVRFKTLQRQLEFIEIQEEYVKDETKNLKRELLRAQVIPGAPASARLAMTKAQYL